MKVQKKISVQGDWAKKFQDISNEDIITIKNEGQIISGDYGERNVFKIETKNGEKLLTFNQTSMNNLIDAYGDETKNWIGKEVKVWIVKASVGGKLKDVIYLTAPDWQMGEDGFYPPENKDINTGDVPVVEEGESTNEINVEDIPF